MLQKVPYIRRSLTFQLILWVGLIVLGSISAWAYVNIKYQMESAIDHMAEESDRLGNTIRLGAHYAMMLNSRDDINQIIHNIARQEGIRNIRIFNKEGQIKFSNVPDEVEQATDIKAEACIICHRSEAPIETVALSGRTRVLHPTGRGRLLGIISPIYNEPGCSESSCHYHPPDKKVLGALDVVVSLKRTDADIQSRKQGIIALAFGTFLGIATMIGIFLYVSVNRPIQKLIGATRLIGQGHYGNGLDLARVDEIGQLATAVHCMGIEIAEKQEELNRQRDQYQNLFEQVPCYITVQDRDFRIITFNEETARQFNPAPGDFCYRAYKGRDEICEVCPVARTLEDGRCHTGEEVVINRDGTETHLFVKTSPIRQSSQEIAAVMEISLDITESKRLEKAVRKSEEKYHNIFNNIPNAVFVVDRETLEVLNCNETATSMYGFGKKEIINYSFMDLFDRNERDAYAAKLKAHNVLNQVRQVTQSGGAIFVNIHISPSEYSGREAFLVVTSDITKKLMAEQQLIQASKMATLGEMSAGVAHELNQPLAVIKTASNYLMKKTRKEEKIPEDILRTMAEEIDSHVDRASRIINHLREFGRKSDVTRGPVRVEEAIKRAHEMFDQQLKLRGISVVKELDEGLPSIQADSNRLEQVFINLLINARDAIEEKVKKIGRKDLKKEILLKCTSGGGKVRIEVADSGVGVPEAVREKVFEPFFTTKKAGQGTGLGLSISYGIVQDYGGVIQLESEELEGTRFIIEFPVADEA